MLNALALAAMALGLRGMGFSGAMALALAALLLLLVSGAHGALGDRRLSGWLALFIAVALGAPVLIAPRLVDRALRGLIDWLFGA